MKTKNKPTLVYGIGNSGRQDDGLAWLFIDHLLSQDSFKGISFEKNYQLNIEDAALIAKYDTVVFVDACSERNVKTFSYNKITPHPTTSFSSHELSCESVLALCHEMYNNEVEAYLLAIKGYEWELIDKLTAKAQDNLEKALAFFKKQNFSTLECISK